MDVRFVRRFVDAGHLIRIEVTLLHTAVGGRDLTHESDTRAERGGAFELRYDAIGIDRLAAIDGHIDTWNTQFSGRVDFYLDDCGHVSEEAAMSGKTPGPAVS